MPPSCERASDLLDAIDREPSPDLHDHLQRCESCRTELALLRQSHGLLTVSDTPVPPATLQAIEAAVLSRVHAPRRIACAIAVPLCVLAATRLLAMVFGNHPLQSPWTAGLLALIPAVLCLRPHDRRLLWAAVAAACFLTLSTVRGDWTLPVRAVACVAVLSGTGIVAAAIPLLLFARGALPGMAWGVAVLAGGLALQTALCSVRDPAHLLTIHLAPFLLGTALSHVLRRQRGTQDA